jgi:hypothetical protein
MMKFYRNAFIAAAGVALLCGFVVIAHAQDDQGDQAGVKPPAPGSQPDACYEDCMYHYVQQNGLVAPKEAAYCARPACHPNKDISACEDTCTADYNTCIQSSPEGYSNQNGLKCMNQITACSATCRQ